jgi:antitoxin component YwqK of YwqJK toxin-antitoxin module
LGRVPQQWPLSRKGSFKSGKREGPWVYYDEDGTKADHSGIYHDGEKVSDLPTVTDQAA